MSSQSGFTYERRVEVINSPMNILYLNHYAGTPSLGMEYRPYYLAREWVRAGHAVTVVAANFSHVRARQPQAEQEEVDGITYHWLPTPGYQGNGLGRVKNIWSFLCQVWRLAPALVAACQPDVVIASSTYPMDIWVARRMARLAGARLVYEVHDLWPASPMELSGMPWWHPFILLCQKAEKDAYRYADRVVSMLPNVAIHMAAHGLDLQKLHIVPNGISPEEWGGPAEALPAPLAAHLQSLRAANRIVVGYAGSHGVPNALDVLLDAATLMQHENMAFVLVGDGPQMPALKQLAAQLGVADRIQFVGHVNHAQVPHELAQLDVYVALSRQESFGVAVIEAGAAARPVVVSNAGGLPEVVLDSVTGLVVPRENPQAAANAIERLLRDADLRQRMAAAARQHVAQHYSGDACVETMLKVYERLVARHRSSR